MITHDYTPPTPKDEGGNGGSGGATRPHDPDPKNQNKKRFSRKWLLLLPFKPLMKLMLKRKGIKPANNIRDLALQFYKYIMKKKIKTLEVEYVDGGSSQVLDETTINAIISAIIEFIRTIRDEVREKEKKGEEVSDWQKDLADTYDDAKDRIVAEGYEETKSAAFPYLVVGFGVLAVFLLFQKGN